jgi:hypothetical protein
MESLTNKIGLFLQNVTVEICKDKSVSRPRVSPVNPDYKDVKVEFPRKLREQFPVKTQFVVTVKVCQKHNKDNSPKGSPYFRAYDISIIPESVPDQGLLAKVKEGSVSGLAYEYVDLKR